MLNVAALSSFLIGLSAPATIVLLAYTLRRRDVPGSLAFALILIGQTIWTIGHWFSHTAFDMAAALGWDLLRYLGTDLGTAGALLLALTLTGRGDAVRRYGGLLVAMPALTLLIAISDQGHGLVRIGPTLLDAGPERVLSYQYGLWFNVFSGYNLLLIVGVAGLLIKQIVVTRPEQRLTVIALAAGLLLPHLGAWLAILNWRELPEGERLHALPLFFTVANLILAWALFRNQLFGLIPVARTMLIDSMHDGVLVVDRYERVVDYNGRALVLLGRPGAALTGYPLAQLLPGHGLIPDPHGAVASTTLELSLAPPRGPRVELEVTITRIATGGGLALGHMFLLRDITERKASQEALAVSEARQRALLAALPDSLLLMNQQGVLIDYLAAAPNAEHRAIAGQVGRRVDEVLPPALAGQILAALEQVSRSRQMASIEYSAMVRGEQRQFETRCVYVREGELLAVSRDISDRQRIVAELTRAKEAAEAAGRAKSALLTTMSHELRTPLSAILGMADLLRGTELTAEQRECAGAIGEAGRVLLAIIDDMLTISNLEAGLLTLERRPFELRVSLEEACAALRPEAEAKGLTLSYCLPEALPAPLVGDPLRLHQLLVKLLANAVKFTERGGVTLCAQLPPGGPLTLTVEDTGIGIAPERLPHIFAPFEQADGSSTRRYGGMGLGLTVARHLAELMGGTLAVSSSQGEGTTFTLRLPLAGWEEQPAQGLPAQLSEG